MNVIDQLEAEEAKKFLPSVHVGDTVEVHYLIREGDKERVQLFIGTIIAMGGRGINRTMTVRRLVQGEGVERIFPVHSPRVKDVVVTRRGRARQAKLYYLRDRVGKSTRVHEFVGDKARKERDGERARREAFAAASEAAETSSEETTDEA
ncbi:MAG: large subunit ribosomal protein L19 [Planctomycetota bacterium]|jgi:large subunit ribosomal protein L19